MMWHWFRMRPRIALLCAGVLLIACAIWWIVHSEAIIWHTGNPITAIAFSPDGQWLASAEETHNELGETKDPLVIVRHSPDGQVRATLTGYHLTIYSLAFSPDGALLVAAGGGGHIRLWRLSDGQLVQTFADGAAKSTIRRITFSPDGKTLAAFSRDGTVRWWQIDDGHVVSTLDLTREGAQDALAFNAPRQLLAARVAPTTIKIWRIGDAHVPTTINSFPQTDFQGVWGRDLYFSPDGQILASIDDQWIIRLWQVDDGHLLATLSGHTDDIASVAFSPDGRILASASGNPYLIFSEQKGSGDKTIRLWSVPDGRSLATLNAHSDLIEGLTFSPDGQWLASGSQDKTIRLWKMQ